eukprot:11664681-Ditylum_brightwellii.AAC.1
MFDLDEESIGWVNTILTEVWASKQRQWNASSQTRIIVYQKVVGEALKKKAPDKSNNVSASCIKGYSCNMSGPRPQDVIPWGGLRPEPDPYPTCHHGFTQAVEFPTYVCEQNVSINAENEKKMKAWESKGHEGQKLLTTSTVSQML